MFLNSGNQMHLGGDKIFLLGDLCIKEIQQGTYSRLYIGLLLAGF